MTIELWYQSVMHAKDTARESNCPVKGFLVRAGSGALASSQSYSAAPASQPGPLCNGTLRHEDRHLGDVQELECALETSNVGAGSGAAMAEHAGAAQPLPPSLAQFAEAQRIILLDAIRTDFSQSGQRSAAGSGNSGSANRGEARETAHLWAYTALQQHVYRGMSSARTVRAGLNTQYPCSRPPAMWGQEEKLALGHDYVLVQKSQCRHHYCPSCEDSFSASRPVVLCCWGRLGQRLGRVAEETLAGATHLTAFERHAAGRLIHLLSAYAVHDPETGYCQVCILPHSLFGGLVNPGTE